MDPQHADNSDRAVPMLRYGAHGEYLDSRHCIRSNRRTSGKQRKRNGKRIKSQRATKNSRI
jgi:hypothetical protein